MTLEGNEVSKPSHLLLDIIGTSLIQLIGEQSPGILLLSGGISNRIVLFI
jgi:hypothetical protein